VFDKKRNLADSVVIFLFETLRNIDLQEAINLNLKIALSQYFSFVHTDA